MSKYKRGQYFIVRGADWDFVGRITKIVEDISPGAPHHVVHYRVVSGLHPKEDDKCWTIGSPWCREMVQLVDSKTAKTLFENKK